MNTENTRLNLDKRALLLDKSQYSNDLLKSLKSKNYLIEKIKELEKKPEPDQNQPEKKQEFERKFFHVFSQKSV